MMTLIFTRAKILTRAIFIIFFYFYTLFFNLISLRKLQRYFYVSKINTATFNDLTFFTALHLLTNFNKHCTNIMYRDFFPNV